MKSEGFVDMNITNKIGRSRVLILKVEEEDVNTIFMNTDIDSEGHLHYAYDEFAKVFSNNVLEYAFAYADIPRDEITQKQREAAQSLLKLHEVQKLRQYFSDGTPETEWEPNLLNWYRKKGVFGEVILHLILKDFKDTIPLISKLYFKDSFAQEAKGFDAVHVSVDGSTLWLGETKFYTNCKTQGVVSGGIDELVSDIKKHLTKDYLSEQFVIIKRGLESQYQHPQRNKWIDILNQPIFLKDVFKYVRIPLLCVYEDKIADEFLQSVDQAAMDAKISVHTTDLLSYYNSINDYEYKDAVETVLILMPIQAKNALIKCMLEKIWHMQNI